MKTIRELTLTVITALFVVTVALLWASASPKGDRKNPPPLPSRHWPRPASHRTRSDCRLGRFISSALARIRYRSFR